MYLPAAFQQPDLTRMFDAMEQYSFGLLTCQADDAPIAEQLPFLLDRQAGARGTLISHMARANPLCRHADGQPVLVVFSGPQAYISPTWYASENVVPTWNYVAVHAHGVFEPVFDTDEILDIVDQTVRRYEGGQAAPWRFDRSTDFARRLAQQVVGFRIELTRLEGKWKLSQNHTPERREGVIAGLRGQGDPQSQQIADLMQQTLPN